MLDCDELSAGAASFNFYMKKKIRQLYSALQIQWSYLGIALSGTIALENLLLLLFFLRDFIFKKTLFE